MAPFFYVVFPKHQSIIMLTDNKFNEGVLSYIN